MLVQDGQQCAGGLGFCYHGVCQTYAEQCQALWGPGKSSVGCLSVTIASPTLFISRVLELLRHHPLRGVDLVHLHIVLMSTCRLWFMVCHWPQYGEHSAYKNRKKSTEKIVKSHSVKKSEAGNRMTASEILLQVHKLPEGVWARPNLCKLAQNKP